MDKHMMANSDLLQEYKDGLTFENQCNLPH